ncbi:MAG TPA: hypothetical protein VHG72_18155 [Polyangia bacterium]|nr:hypothetical protein [Polyangia bacterium]
MFRRLFALIVVSLLMSGFVFWSDVSLLLFGRCDAVAWAASHQVPEPPPAAPGRHNARVLETRRIVPSDGLPPTVDVKRSNNNLDAIRFGGRTYLAFRTADSHFAGDSTVMNVVSSEDERTWRQEAKFSLGRDLREPRWLALKGRLFLYVSVLGTHSYSFDPVGVDMTELAPNGTFGPLEPAGLPGRIAWRTRAIDGRGYMTAYRGGEHLYSLNREPMDVELYATADGRHWQPADPAHPVVSRGGGSETDFALLPGGSLFGVIRNEEGDETGWGSKLCRATAGALGAWTCTSDPRKFDSPDVFTHDGEVYLFARRNLANDGRYDLGAGSGFLRMLRNQLAYITEAKRCSLWRYDPDGGKVGFVLDLPSRGDTCFASVLPGEKPDQIVVYDYSSNLDGPDLPWTAAQRRPTFIYRHVLELAPR